MSPPFLITCEVKNEKNYKTNINNLDVHTDVSVRTIYRYIDNGIFPNLTRKSLPYKGKRQKKKKTTIIRTESKLGKSIEKRPEDVSSHATFGHWELDTVIDKRENGETLLVFTERKTRYQFIFRSVHQNEYLTKNKIR